MGVGTGCGIEAHVQGCRGCTDLGRNQSSAKACAVSCCDAAQQSHAIETQEITCGGISDGILAIGPHSAKVELVVTGPACQAIAAFIACDDVRPGGTVQRVIARKALDAVGFAATCNVEAFDVDEAGFTTSPVAEMACHQPLE